jgi:WD40 repeat protein
MELLDAYLDGRLTAAERADLSATLASSPEACRLFWSAIHQHAQIAELFAEARGLALAQEEQPFPCAAGVKLFIPDEPAPVGAPRRRTGFVRLLTRWLALTAAAVLLALGVTWLVRLPDDSEAPDTGLAHLAELHGEVHVKADEDLHLGRAGQVLRPGEEIHTGEGSFAVVTYADSSRIELGADTAVQLLSPADRANAGKGIFLVKGAVSANVAPQPHGQPLLLRTHQADLLAAGTRFRSASVLDETRVELVEGKAMLARKGDSRTVEIHTGYYAVAAGDHGEMIRPAPMLPARGKPLAMLDEGSGPVLALAAAGPRTLAIGCFNGLVKLWDLRTRKITARLDAGRSRTLALACTRDGRTLAVGCDSTNKRDPGVVLWDLRTRRHLPDLAMARKAHALAFTPDGQTLAFAGPEGRQKGVVVWDIADRRERIILGERSDRVQCLAISPDGRIAAAGCRDGQIRLWNLLTGRVESTIPAHQREVQCLAFQPGGRLLASGGRDGLVRLWSLPAGDEVRVLSGAFKEVRCLTFSPDGRTLATGHGGTAVLWDVAQGTQRSTLKAHQFAITAIVYLNGGRTLATAGWDRTVKLWDLHPVP